MGLLVASLLALATLLGVAPAVAAPPDDIAAYCRATQGPVQQQTRCLYMERAAQGRVGRTRASVNAEAWAQCQAVSPSWSAMETCVRQASATPGTAGGAPATPGATAAPGGGATSTDTGTPAAAPSIGERGDRPADPSRATAAPGADGAAATPPASEPPTPSGSPSTVILGPQPGAPAGAAETNRASRPVSEAEAERQLKGVLERSGEPGARCTKRQYGPGWVTICE